MIPRTTVLVRATVASLLLAFVSLLVIATPAHAAVPFQPAVGDPLLEPWRWRTFPELSGLNASCVAESSDGALWFGAGEAVWRFDGLAWTHESTENVVGGTPDTLCGGPAGDVLAGGRWGISRWQGGVWARLFPVSGGRVLDVRKLTVARDGAVWAATSLGVLHFDGATWTLYSDEHGHGQLQSRSFQPAVAFQLLPDAVLNRPRPVANVRRMDLTEIVEDTRGRIWAGTDDGEILCLTPDAPPETTPGPRPAPTGTWSIHNELDGLVCGRRPAILPLRDGRVWVAYGSASGHAHVFDGTSWSATRLADHGVPGDCSHPLQTRDGAIWVSGRYVVSVLRDGRWRSYARPEFPIPSAQNFLHQARDGALWIGGPGTEIQRIDYETSRWLTLHDLNFQCESPAGTSWFLHRSGRVVVQRGEEWRSLGAEDGLIDTPVALIATDAGEIWAAGSHGRTAASARFADGRWTRFVHDELAWGVDWHGVFASSDGSIWLAAAVDSRAPKAHRAGILQFRDGVWRHHHQPGRSSPSGGDNDPSLLLPATQHPEPIGKFLCLGESPRGHIWAGRNILIAHDGRTWRVFDPGEQLRLGIIETMFTSREGALWVGTRQFGALRHDETGWHRVTARDGLAANGVRSFAQTSDGSIWAATDRDFSRFDGTTWTNTHLPAALNLPLDGGTIRASTSGRLWINRFDPDWMRRAWSKAAPVDLATCEFHTVAHRPSGPPPETTLLPGPREIAQPGNLSVLWRGTSPWRSETDAFLQYSHRLDGAGWSAFSTATGHAFFTLPHGRHRLEVRARDRDFNVDPTPAVLEFVVLPPVWRQAWFLALVAVLAAAAGAQSLRLVRERARLRSTNRALAEEISVRRRTEDALRVGEATLTEAQQLARLGSWTMDLDRNHLEWSAEVYRIFEVDPREFAVGYETFLQRVHPDDREAVDQTCRQFARDHRPFDIEHRIVTPAGQIKFINLRSRAVHAPDGRLLHHLGTAQDITERKLAEQRIWKLNRTYAVLSDINALIVREREAAAILEKSCRIAVDTGGFALAWVGLHDRETGRTTVAALAGGTTRLIAAVHEAAAGTPPAPTPPEVSRGSVVCNDLSRTTAHPLREVALAEGCRSMVTLPLVVSGRDAGALVLYAAETDFFDVNELHLLEELAKDIAFALEVCEGEQERQRAIGQLRTSEERFRQLAETIEDVFWITDPAKHQMLYVSPAYEGIWGRPRRELYDHPRSWLDAVHPDDRARIASAVETRQVLGTYDEEYRITRPDGEVRWIRDRAFPVRSANGRVERVLGVARDITTSRELEARLRQAQKLEAIGQLAGGVAHDFNNILAAITMQVELAELAENLPAEAAEELREIRAAASRAANLTRQLLLFSRQQMLQTHDVDLNEIVGNLARMLQRIIGEDIHLRLDLHPAPLVTSADPGMLDQILLNLAVNARDAMPAGGHLTIKTGTHDLEEAAARRLPDVSPGRQVWMSVTDTGTGIPPEVMPRIYEPFFTTKEPGRGTGLGLATVFGIVKQHHGWIKLDTAVGRGTTFQVFLPASATTATADVAAPATAHATGGTETVLIVEDDPSVRATTRSFLARHGYRVLEAASGVRALAVWHEHRDTISLLLTDMVMPDHISGQDLARHLRAERPALKVIFTSGYTSAFAGRQVAVEPDEIFLQKPYPPEDLLAAIRRCLDRGEGRPVGAAAEA